MLTLLNENVAHAIRKRTHIHDFQSTAHIHLLFSGNLKVYEIGKVDPNERQDPQNAGIVIEAVRGKKVLKEWHSLKDDSCRREVAKEVEERDRKFDHCALPVILLHKVVLPS